MNIAIILQNKGENALMKLLQFVQHDQTRLGIIVEDKVIDIHAASERLGLVAPATLDKAIEQGLESITQLNRIAAAALEQQDAEYVYNASAVTYAPVLSNPQKIICVGLNYRKHAEETKAEIPTSPILFNKFTNSLSAHEANVELPSVSKEVDYEAELAIIIGKQAKDVDEADALEHVFGYSCANDLSARDLQRRTSQWLLGKSCDGFAPIGPYLVTADEVGNPDKLSISCRVNGVLKQSSSTADMIFSCSQIISYISRHMTLYPGDLILTGTPEGVAIGYPKDQRVFLKHGDVVEVEIEKLGLLRTTMISAH